MKYLSTLSIPLERLCSQFHLYKFLLEWIHVYHWSPRSFAAFVKAQNVTNSCCNRFRLWSLSFQLSSWWAISYWSKFQESENLVGSKKFQRGSVPWGQKFPGAKLSWKQRISSNEEILCRAALADFRKKWQIKKLPLLWWSRWTTKKYTDLNSTLLLKMLNMIWEVIRKNGNLPKYGIMTSAGGEGIYW